MLIGKIRSPERRVMKLISLLIIALVLLCLGSMAQSEPGTFAPKNLAWDAPSNWDTQDIVKFRIYDNNVKIDEVEGGDSLSYPLIETEGHHEYAVTAVNALGDESVLSNVVIRDAVLPAHPSNARVEAQ